MAGDAQAAVRSRLQSSETLHDDEQQLQAPRVRRMSRVAMTDTPTESRPGSPRIPPTRATTLDIPGLTKSKVSPDGRIPSRDIGSKLMVVMVGLPARGKSYIVKKLARYLNWLQHETRTFNVGNRRRQASTRELQDADFFSPNNQAAQTLREKVAIETLEEALRFLLSGSGSVAILDATNSTIQRRATIFKRIREQSTELKILFIESICTDEQLLEANMRLKLSGPDYKDMDPLLALRDFKERVKNYERQYEPIGELEEKIDGFQYCKMIDVGRKVISYKIDGFLAGQAVYFLLNFNLSERQIWITRHGESVDNEAGRLGGDSTLTPNGIKYAQALAALISKQKQLFHQRQIEAYKQPLLPQQSGEQLDLEGRNPEISHVNSAGLPEEKHFCVWTSMLQRSVLSAQFFDDEVFDIKAMRMLDELNVGKCEGMTYDEIKSRFPHEYEARQRDKLHYRFPGAGAEAYTDIIYRLSGVIMEIERMVDNVLIIAHRAVSRTLLAYFLGLKRELITDLDMPLNHLFVVEPKPYGVACRIFRFNEDSNCFDEVENELSFTDRS